MSAQDIIAQIDALPDDQRELVFEHLRRLKVNEVPDSFRRGMAEALAGRGVEMEVALNEPPKKR